MPAGFLVCWDGDNSMSRRLLWMSPGLVAGTILAFTLRSLFESRFAAFISDQLPLVCGIASLAIAERRGKAPTAEEATRPITLFGKQFKSK